MTAPFALADTAYLTIIKHLAKYLHAISGLLLGPPTSPVRITCALPVVHSSLAIATTPLTETALLLAERRAAQLNLRVVGAYFGNDLAEDTSIGVFPTRLADAVRAHFEGACLLMIHPPSLHPDVRKGEHCFRVCAIPEGETGTWAKATKPKESLHVSQEALKGADLLLSGDASVHEVVDFEDHCLDPKTDWLSHHIHIDSTGGERCAS